MKKFYGIINNNTGAPATEIDEDNELRFDLVEGTESDIQNIAHDRQATRIHLYEETINDYDMTIYKYLTTTSVGK